MHLGLLKELVERLLHLLLHLHHLELHLQVRLGLLLLLLLRGWCPRRRQRHLGLPVRLQRRRGLHHVSQERVEHV
jgi:hypothetical protein